eukprot:TRINITY_DN13774_c0_g1_i2.p1 TRINITY_DN13774_c0_g1~~TRINITY_DN13774_c0_g1_i2.p1  ORF type:complete len:369 (+),score=53.99 TRINITY_DN13774_c0_g1_i2:46-1107(+)
MLRRAGLLAVGAAAVYEGSRVHAAPPSQMVELVFLGTGSSVSVPSLRCLTSGKTCNVCSGAASGDKNKRNNPSILLKVPQTDRATGAVSSYRTVMVDCGKTFRDSAITLFNKIGVSAIDAIFLTHYHADAVLGLDDIRDFQRIIKPPDFLNRIPSQVASTPVHCDEETFSRMKDVFPYLIPKEIDHKVHEVRFVSNLTWNIMKPFQRHHVEGLNIRNIPVTHGRECLCQGYEIESKDCRVVYLSDVSEIPPDAHQVLMKGKQIDVLIVDALFLERRHNTHFSLPEALETARKYQPKQTYLVGMGHEFDYYSTNNELKALRKKEGLAVEMAHDGLILNLPLLDGPIMEDGCSKL